MRNRLVRHNFAEVGKAVLADVALHQSIVPCSAPALNSGVMPELIERDAESDPEYRISPAPEVSSPTEKWVAVADPAVHSPNCTVAVLLT